MTSGSSTYSSHALLHAVTVRSSRASAWVRTFLWSGTTAPWLRRTMGRCYRVSLHGFAGFTARSDLTLFTRAVQLRHSETETASEPVTSADRIASSARSRRRRMGRGRLITLVVLLLVVVAVVLAIAAIPLLQAR